MSEIYIVREDGRTEPLAQVRCRNEDEELQSLLERNLDLLPGTQIRPEDPRRWLLVKREMPVPDPGGGGDRWSIDFFLVDQDGVPTFVECKRFLDTRSRREVVGQMLEYAANGPELWTRDDIRKYASETAAMQGRNLDDAVRRLDPPAADTPEDLLDLIENNLREGQVRLVFFLEEAPIELKSIVDFLNRQTERSEILIVEAKQYERDGMRLVSPRLFGYTEQARRVKRPVTITPGARRKWTEDDFFADASGKVSESESTALRRLLAFANSNNLDVNWGTGAHTGSFNVIVPGLSRKSILSAMTTGDLSYNFGWLDDTPETERFRDKFAELVRERMNMTLAEDALARYPVAKAGNWAPKIATLLQLLEELLARKADT